MEADKTVETSSILIAPQLLGSAQRSVRTLTPWFRSSLKSR